MLGSLPPILKMDLNHIQAMCDFYVYVSIVGIITIYNHLLFYGSMLHVCLSVHRFDFAIKNNRIGLSVAVADFTVEAIIALVLTPTSRLFRRKRFGVRLLG